MAVVILRGQMPSLADGYGYGYGYGYGVIAY